MEKVINMKKPKFGKCVFCQRLVSQPEYTVCDICYNQAHKYLKEIELTPDELIKLFNEFVPVIILVQCFQRYVELIERFKQLRID